MEESKKKMIMIGLVVACIAAAVVITLKTRSDETGGLGSIKSGTMIWMKCRSPKCENTWQMDKKAYFEYAEKNRSGMTVPGVVCPKCNEADGYRAEKCPKCDTIFERITGGDVPDRCPKCGYSALEELRKKARGGAAAPKPAAEEKK